MKPHVKRYYNHFGYDSSDFIPCEVCQKKAVDINHIKPRGMGGTKKSETIENLMAVCSECHVKYGDKKKYLSLLISAHQNKLNGNK